MSDLAVARRQVFTTQTWSYDSGNETDPVTNTRVITWNDFVTRPPVPNYRQKIGNGTNATSTLTGERGYIESSPGLILYHYNSNNNVNPFFDRFRKVSGDLYNGVNLPPFPSTSMLTAADNAAKAKAHANINAIYTAFQGGVFLGELRETLRMLRNPGEALRHGIDDYFNALKKGRRGSRDYRRRYLAETWLEYSFGWLPLFNDIRSASKLLHKRRRQLEQELIRFNGEGENKVTSFSAFVTDSVGDLKLRYRTRTISGYRVRYYGAVRSKAQTPASMDLDLLGFHPRSFVPTAWNLIPYTFLVDYFTNMGQVIDAWANQNADYAWVARTVHREAVRQVVDQSNPNFVGSSYKIHQTVFHPGSWFGRSSRVERISLPGVGVPSLEFRIPGFGLKWLNIAALARTHRSLTPYY